MTRCHDCIEQPQALRSSSTAGLAAGCSSPVGTLTGCLVRGLPVATTCGLCCLSLIGSRICWRVGGMRDIPVEALFPEGGERLELGSSGWSRALGINAVGGPPYCDFADEGGAQMACDSPNWLIVASGCEVSNLVGQVGDVLVWPGSYPRRDGPESRVERVAARAAVLLRVSGML